MGEVGLLEEAALELACLGLWVGGVMGVRVRAGNPNVRVWVRVGVGAGARVGVRIRVGIRVRGK